MVRDGEREDELFVLRLWPAGHVLQPGDQPLWLGSAQTLRHTRHFKWIGMWHPLRGVDPALQAVRGALQGSLPEAQDMHPQSGLPVLRIRTDDAPQVDGPAG